MNDIQIQTILGAIKSRKVKTSEFLDIITNKELQFSVFYEIIKDRYQ